MSTDLELRQEMIEIIRLPVMKIKISQSSDITEDDDGSGINIQSENSTSNGDEDECRTPKLAQNMIPKILSCPPAPKKPRRVALSSCKRKLSEFFEFLASEEVESFFQQFDVNSSNGVIKKRCLV
ncbi:hypothetical protein ACH5RR_016362 [Cinchona calisaya]|uniref:Uncharacterized protein n=1 Tax=Cinchona calisaya TaxID=153742 RepID=A0ABD2ZW48_9GENT